MSKKVAQRLSAEQVRWFLDQMGDPAPIDVWIPVTLTTGKSAEIRVYQHSGVFFIGVRMNTVVKMPSGRYPAVEEFSINTSSYVIREKPLRISRIPLVPNRRRRKRGSR
jgi:hypothetical protein